MALLGFEGFDQLASPPVDLTVMPGWSHLAGSSVVTKVAGVLGQSAITFGGAGNDNYLFAPGSNYSTLICGFKWRSSPILATSTAGTILRFYDSITVQCTLGTTGTLNRLAFWRGDKATLLTTSTFAPVANTWYDVEIKVTFSGTVGIYEVHVDGNTVIGPISNANTITTANATASGIAIGSYFNTAAGAVIGYDDLYLCDDTTGSNNTFLGNVRVETLFPTGTNATTWTPLSSTNLSQVQETNMDSDTTYNVTSTSNQTDTFSHAALSGSATTIYAADVVACIRKDDPSHQAVETVIISNGTTQAGASNSPSTSYQYFRDSYQTDPHTNAAWTAGNVNSTLIGYKHV